MLLVHGTGSTGKESWGSGPYVQVLPTVGKGYDVCWVSGLDSALGWSRAQCSGRSPFPFASDMQIDLPNRSLTDAQLSASYVAHAIHHLAAQSSTSRISTIGHSQGAGLNIQWALQFYPSTIPLVQNYIGLAPDFKGTAESLALCLKGVGHPTCAKSVWQQTVGSRYLKAQNSMKVGGGGRALVPTTAILTVSSRARRYHSGRCAAFQGLKFTHRALHTSNYHCTDHRRRHPTRTPSLTRHLQPRRRPCTWPSRCGLLRYRPRSRPLLSYRRQWCLRIGESYAGSGPTNLDGEV